MVYKTVAYKIIFARRSTRTSITGQHGHEGPFEEVHEELSGMIAGFKGLAADGDVTTLAVRGPDGKLMSDTELQRLTGFTGR